jgi:hypothetical protein
MVCRSQLHYFRHKFLLTHHKIELFSRAHGSLGFVIFDYKSVNAMHNRFSHASCPGIVMHNITSPSLKQSKAW